MSVTMRPYRKRGKVSGWEADIRVSLPGLPEIRERRKAPGDYHSAMKWGQAIERWLIGYYTNRDPRQGLTHDLSRMGKEDADTQPEGPTGPRVPTFAEFWPRYMTGHCEANRLSPATIQQKRSYYKEHLGPAFGSMPLDEITVVDIETFKGARTKLMASTVNLGLKHLAAALAKAVEWGVIDKAPRVKQIREKQKRPEFYDFEQYDRLVLAAEAHPNPLALLVVLLGGEAGLRVGEILGLRWSDVDFRAGAVHVNRSISHVKNPGEAGRDVVGPPKGGRARSVPMPDRLRDALRAHRKLGDCPVITNPRGEPARKYVVEDRLYDCQDAAGFPRKGPHILRHTYGSRLAMAGQPAIAIQGLMGHEDVRMTCRYMHLAPAVATDAAKALNRPPNWRHGGATPAPVEETL